VLLGDEGGLTLIDDEWSADGGIDRELATIRAMWKLAWVMVASGTDHPWPATASINEISVSLMGLLSGSVGADPLERLYAAEAELLAVVAGGSASDHLENLRTAGRRSVAGSSGSPLAAIRSRLSWLRRLPGGRWLARATRGH
jgi:hypothetical protein